MENQEENHPLTPDELKQISSSISILPDLSKEQYEKFFKIRRISPKIPKNSTRNDDKYSSIIRFNFK